MESCTFNLVLCAALLSGASCAGDEPIVMVTSDPLDQGREPTVPRFIDAQVYFQTSEEIDAWYALVAELKSDFDDICADTFCEGEFSNYESLRFRCSVEEATGILGRCLWVLAASNEEIAPATGEVLVDGRTFACPMPIALGTDIRDLVAALTSSGLRAIYAPMPGNGHAPFDGLADCL